MAEHFDVIVIGSGAGGGTLTWSLAPTGKRVLLLERGGWYPREKENWNSKAVWGDLRYRNAGKWTDATNGKEFNPKQHYYVGGNTKVYGAVLFRFRERDFGPVQHVDGVSPAWPLTYADFAPWYTQAERLYHVHGERGLDPMDPPGDPYPYPAMSHEPRIAQLAEDLAGAGLTPFSLPMGIMIDETSPERSPCIRCATCDGFACLVRAKADAQVVCVEPALEHPNVTMLTNAHVTRLRTGADGRAVTSVEVERDGQHEEYSADVVVVAAGAINSSALLLASANERHPDGLGNSSGLLGRNLMLHNNSSLIAISKVPNPTVFEKTLGVNDYYFGDGEWDYPLGAMQMLGRSDAFTISLDAPHAEDPADLAAHALDFWLTTEDLPRPDNRVQLGADGRIMLTYTPTNLEAHARLTAKFRDLLDAMRCHKDMIERDSYLGGRLGVSGVAHQNGTARFGDDPTTSVLDLNCRMHDLDNVYVADSSFFVSSTSVNPTLTIIANALRVGNHLAERLG